MKQALLIVDHGSRRAGSYELLREVAALMRERLGISIVHYAHMELGEPTIQQGFDACIADGAEEVIVHPYFLSPGHHVTTGIPALVTQAASRHPGVACRITKPLGVHPKIGEVILERMTESHNDNPISAVPLETEVARDGVHPHGHLRDSEAPFRFCPRCGTALAPRRIKPDGPKLQACPGCSFVYYPNPKVAAGTIFTLDGGIVLVQRAISPAYGKWVFPGGFVDRGERAEAAAIRETLEEVNLHVEIDRLLNVYSYEDSVAVIIAYAAHVVGGELQAKDEALDVKIFSPSSIPWDDLAFRSAHDAIKEYLAQYC
ncbi:Sirohydrochlorin ferrochelatase [Candidatus Methylomirabilis lanthanidiphila]|uniref:Sirohydrochlorin ferrochelatase n=1 Tax=Candidatus Methylomirabilis lanthanidiphila TaxID=2211376 RepID=A0A564ZMD1_9BACT|nr:NUDIX domain-containing protein [Candidatus Methylomirabilis lanthanidiphila]VUZ85718.1 Sirohydrochlorin ferrochelatase [Candidatus Methylomirabilis lanthanidiphila]